MTIRRKLMVVRIIGVVAWLSTSCSAAGPKPDDATISANMKAALTKITGVVDVVAKYAGSAGMGSTMLVTVNIASADKAAAVQTLKAAVKAVVENSTAASPTTDVDLGCNYGGTNGQSIDLTAISLSQNPTLSELRDYVKNS